MKEGGRGGGQVVGGKGRIRVDVVLLSQSKLDASHLNHVTNTSMCV